MSLDLVSAGKWWMGHSCDGSSGCWPVLSDILAGKRLDVFTGWGGHAEVAASHFSGPRVNIASALSPAAFLPCTWLLRWSPYLCFSPAGVSYRSGAFKLYSFGNLHFEVYLLFCVIALLLFLGFFLQRSCIWEWEKDCSLRLSDTPLSVH